MSSWRRLLTMLHRTPWSAWVGVPFSYYSHPPRSRTFFVSMDSILSLFLCRLSTIDGQPGHILLAVFQRLRNINFDTGFKRQDCYLLPLTTLFCQATWAYHHMRIPCTNYVTLLPWTSAQMSILKCVQSGYKLLRTCMRQGWAIRMACSETSIAGWPKIGGATHVVHVTPGCGSRKLT